MPVCHRIIELFELEGTFKGHLVQLPRNELYLPICSQIRVHRAQSSLTLNAFLSPEGHKASGHESSGFAHFFVFGCEFVTKFALL